MLTIVGVRTSTDAASIIERLAQTSRQQSSFIAVKTAEGTLDTRFREFVGKVVIGETREGYTVMIPLGEEGLRDSYRPTIILTKKSD